MAELCDSVIAAINKLTDLSDDSSIELLNKLCYISSCFKHTLQFRYTDQIKELLLRYGSEKFLAEFGGLNHMVKLKFLQNIYHLAAYYKTDSNLLPIVDNLVEQLQVKQLLGDFQGFADIYTSAKVFSDINPKRDMVSTVHYYRTLSDLSFNYPPIDLTYHEKRPCEAILRLLKLTGFDMSFVTVVPAVAASIGEGNNFASAVITKIHNFTVCECHYRPLFQLLKSVLEGRWTVCVGPSSCGKSELLKNLACGYFAKPQYPYFNSVPMGSHVDSSVLHGMYVCSSNEPGRYVWKPGFIPQSLSLGSWMVMENWEHSNQLIHSYLAPVVNDVMSYIPNVGYVSAGNRRFHLFVTKTVQSTHPTQNYDNFGNSDELGGLFPNCEVVHFSAYTTDDVALITSHVFGGELAPILSDVMAVFDHSIKSSAELGLPLKALFRLCQCIVTLQSDEFSRIFVDEGSKSCAIELINPELLVKVVLDFLCPTTFCAPVSDANTTLSPSRKPRPIIEFIGWVCSWFNITMDSLYKYVIRDLTDDYTGDNFFMTKSVRKTLHSIETCVANRFPVLLVGETGAGKTSLVQRLVECTAQVHTTLKVINMGVQSDSSDLIGGFKPIPLVSQLIELFQTLQDAKVPLPNQYLQGTKQKLEQLGTQGVPTKSSGNATLNQMKTIIQELQKRLKFLAVSEKLKAKYNQRAGAISSLIDQGVGVCFQFKEGVLLDCMRHGHWLLIDEINMASADTLHVISLVLNDQLPSILFLADDDLNQFDFKVHPDFRLFGCMNPPTDVNKKSLPPSLQSFFCQVSVDDSVDFSDLNLIVAGYLKSFELPSEVVSKIVDIYMFLRDAQAKSTITNGIRNFCRMLVIARHNYCRNLPRSLYEAVLVVYSGFLFSSVGQKWHGQLSDHFVELLQLYNRRFPSDKREKAATKSPSNPHSQSLLWTYERPVSCHFDSQQSCVQVEGYWLMKGSTIPAFDDPTLGNYLQTATVKKNLKTMCRILSFSQFPILLEGETSVGKTSVITYLSKLTHNKCIRINNHDHTDIQDYVGGYTCEDGSFHFREGPLVTAMKRGYWVILDELNLAPPDVLEMINRVLDDNRELFVAETMETVKASPSFRLFATQNPMTSGYSGRKPLSRAFRNRFIELHFEELPRQEQIDIIGKVGRIGNQYATFLVDIMVDLRTKRKISGIFQGKYGFVTLRDLFKIASRFDAINSHQTASSSISRTSFPSKIRKQPARQLIDWKLVLAHITLMVLGGKCRDCDDLQVVVDCINRLHKKAVEQVADIFTFSYVYCDLLWPSLKDSISKMVTDQSSGFDHLVVNDSFQKTLLLSFGALNNAEPLLLIGPPGTGKTTLCELYAQLTKRQLFTLSCHSGTETADFIGSLYPVRKAADASSTLNDQQQQQQLFEWVDGPLLEAMKCGGVFLLDEISLADDAVLERMNSLLESNTRSLVVAERGMIANQQSAYTVTAHPDFRLVATMNPSGDYGKKELTNALRNRFTEVYCASYATKEKVAEIIATNVPHECVPRLNSELSTGTTATECDSKQSFISHLLHFLDLIANDMLSGSCWESLVSIRKVVFMIKFVKRQVHELSSTYKLSGHDRFDPNNTCSVTSDRPPTHSQNLLHSKNQECLDNLWFIWWESICAVFLDRYPQKVIGGCDVDDRLIEYRELFSERVKHSTLAIESSDRCPKFTVYNQWNRRCFGVHPYYFETNSTDVYGDGLDVVASRFDFESVSESCYKIFRGMTVGQPILLEGPPGSGKTSIVMNLAKHANKPIVRINLSEQTEIADLFGFDMPSFDPDQGVIRFEWKNGPFLDAMQKGSWILLDEINLAPQTVLEGLNACFDHRGEIYVNSLGKRFTVDRENTRIFASQNPAELGGGRKQLPASFTDRFLRIYFNPLSESTISKICCYTYFDGNECSPPLKLLCEMFHVLSQFPPDCATNEITRTSVGGAGDWSQNQFYQMKTNFRSISRWCELSKNATVATWEVLFYNFVVVFLFAIKRADLRMRLTEFLWYGLSCKFATVSQPRSNYDEILSYFKMKLNRETISFGHFSLEQPRSNHFISYVGFEWLNGGVVCPSLGPVFASICCAITHRMPLILYSCSQHGENKLQLFEMLKFFSARNVHFISADSEMDIQYLLGGYEISSVGHLLTSTLFELENLYNQVQPSHSKATLSVCADCYNLKNNHLHPLLTLLNLINSNANSIHKIRDSIQSFIHFLNTAFCCSHLTKVVRLHCEELLPKLELLADKIGCDGSSSGFQWVNGHLIDCMINGRWCVIDNANLCSLSVLDRLNGLLEPNGSLVLDHFDGRTITPHRDFRLFLLCDLSAGGGGELSDAMRNRCLEFYMEESVAVGNPVQSPLKYLVYDRDVVLVKVLLDTINSAHCDVTEKLLSSCFLNSPRQFQLFTALIFNRCPANSSVALLNVNSTPQFFSDICGGNATNHHMSYVCDVERFGEWKRLYMPSNSIHSYPAVCATNNSNGEIVDYLQIRPCDAVQLLKSNFHAMMLKCYMCNGVATSEVSPTLPTSQYMHSCWEVLREGYSKLLYVCDRLTAAFANSYVEAYEFLPTKLALNVSLFCVWLTSLTDCLLNSVLTECDQSQVLQYHWVWFCVLGESATGLNDVPKQLNSSEQFATSSKLLADLFSGSSRSSGLLDRKFLGCDMSELVIFITSYRLNIRCPTLGVNSEDSTLLDRFAGAYEYFNTTLQKSPHMVAQCANTVFNSTLSPSDPHYYSNKPNLSIVRLFRHLLSIIISSCSADYSAIASQTNRCDEDIRNAYFGSKSTSILLTSAVVSGGLSPEDADSFAMSHLLRCEALSALNNTFLCSGGKCFLPQTLELLLPHLYFSRKLTQYRQPKNTYEFLLSLTTDHSAHLNMPLKAYLTAATKATSNIHYIDNNFALLVDWPFEISDQIISVAMNEVDLFERFATECLSSAYFRNSNYGDSNVAHVDHLKEVYAEVIQPTKISLTSVASQLKSTSSRDSVSFAGYCLGEIGDRLFTVSCQWCRLLCVSSKVDLAEVHTHISSRLDDYFGGVSRQSELFEMLDLKFNQTHRSASTSVTTDADQLGEKTKPLAHFFNLILAQRAHLSNRYTQLHRSADNYGRLRELLNSISHFIAEILSCRLQGAELSVKLGSFITALLDSQYRSYLDLTICLASRLLLVRFSLQLLYWSSTVVPSMNVDSVPISRTVDHLSLNKDYLDYLCELVEQPSATETLSHVKFIDDKLQLTQTITVLYLAFLNLCKVAVLCRDSRHILSRFRCLLSSFSTLKVELSKKISAHQLAQSSLYKYQSHTYNDAEDTEDNIHSNIKRFFNDVDTDNEDNEEDDDDELLSDDSVHFELKNKRHSNQGIRDSYSLEDLFQLCNGCISKICFYLTSGERVQCNNGDLFISYQDFVFGRLAEQNQCSFSSSHNEINLSRVRLFFASLLTTVEEQPNHTPLKQLQDVDIYHRAFPSLVISSSTLIETIKQTANKHLQEYPEHASLLDAVKACRAYLAIAMDSPLIHYLNSATKLLMTLENWNAISPTELHFADQLAQLKTLIVGWRQMQTRNWIAVVDSHRNQILSSYAHTVSDVVICLDIVRSCSSGDEQFLDACDKLQIVVKDFVEKSCLVDFQTKLDCLRYFGRDQLVTGLHSHLPHNPLHVDRQFRLYWLFENLHCFYSQFAPAIQQHSDAAVAAPLTIIKDFVDAAKWKSFNYWSIKESTDKAHRVVYTNCKKLEAIYRQSVKSFFVCAGLESVVNDFKRDSSLVDDPKLPLDDCLAGSGEETAVLRSLIHSAESSAKFSLFSQKAEHCIRKSISNYHNNRADAQQKLEFTWSLVEQLDQLLVDERSATKQSQKDINRTKSGLLIRVLNNLKINFDLSYRRGIALKNVAHSDDKFYSVFSLGDGNPPDTAQLIDNCQQLYCSVLASFLNYRSCGKYSPDLHLSLVERMSGYMELLLELVKKERYQLFKCDAFARCLRGYVHKFENLKQFAQHSQPQLAPRYDSVATLVSAINKIIVTVDYFRTLLPAFRKCYPQLEAFLDEIMIMVGGVKLSSGNHSECDTAEWNGLVLLEKNLNLIDEMVERVQLPTRLKTTLQNVIKLCADVLEPTIIDFSTVVSGIYKVDPVIDRFILLHQNALRISTQKDCVEFVNGWLEGAGENGLLALVDQLYEGVLAGKFVLTVDDCNRVMFCIGTTARLCSGLHHQLLVGHHSQLLFCKVLFGWFCDVLSNGYTPTVADEQQEQLTDGDSNVGGFNICENPSAACQDVSNQIENQEQVEENQQQPTTTNQQTQLDDETEGIEMDGDCEDFLNQLFGNGLIDDESVDDDVNGEFDQHTQVMEEFDEKLWQDELADDDDNDGTSSSNNKPTHIEETNTVANEDNEELMSDNDGCTDLAKSDSDLTDVDGDSTQDHNSDGSSCGEVEMDSASGGNGDLDEQQPNENDNNIGDDEDENATANTMPTGVSLYNDQQQPSHLEDAPLSEWRVNSSASTVDPNQQPNDQNDGSGGAPSTVEATTPMNDTIFECQKRSQTSTACDQKQPADLRDESYPLKRANIVDRNDNDNHTDPNTLADSAAAVTHTNPSQKFDSLAVDFADKDDQPNPLPNTDKDTAAAAADGFERLLDENMNSIKEDKVDGKNDKTLKDGFPVQINPAVDEQTATGANTEDSLIDRFNSVDSWCVFGNERAPTATAHLNTNPTEVSTSHGVGHVQIEGASQQSGLMSKWLEYVKSVESYSHELCEQLRTIIEPTQAKKLGGSYRTGKKLNMRKVITYLASQFTKDRIWMRRIKPTQRNYQIMLAIDDSTSMQDNQSKDMAFQSLALLTSAFNLLDIGQVGLCSYGECVRQLMHFDHKHTPTSSFYATNVMSQLTFSQRKTNVATLLTHCTNEFKCHLQSNSLSTQLLVILSDGRGIFSEGTKLVHDAVNKMKSLGIFVLYVILDNPHVNKEPIDKIQVPIFEGGKLVHIKSYMEQFPFSHYIVLRKITALPHVIAQAVRQWVEVVTMSDSG